MKTLFRISWLIYLSILDKARRSATISILSWYKHTEKNTDTSKSEKDVAPNPGVIFLQAYPTANIVRHI